MEQWKNSFLNELAKELGDHSEKPDILLEYEAHLEEMILELFDCDKNTIIEQIIFRVGKPKEIAQMWKEEFSVTKSNMKWLFIILNIFFFITGSLLTLFHNLFQWNWLSWIWERLTAIPTLIAFIYLFFWALLGYEIGKGFGHGGKALLKKTFFYSLIPNLFLMILIVLHIIPHSWFAPILTKSFIFVCILFTMILYPVCWIGFRWGKKASI